MPRSPSDLAPEWQHSGRCQVIDHQAKDLCATCKRHPANTGWNARPVTGAPIDEERDGPQGDRIADLMDSPLRPVGAAAAQILDLTRYTVRVPVRPAGRARARMEWLPTRESCPLTYEEIAHLVGVSRRTVIRVLARYATTFSEWQDARHGDP